LFVSGGLLTPLPFLTQFLRYHELQAGKRFTYPSLVRLPKWQSYLRIFGRCYDPQVGERLRVVLFHYLNVCDHNPPTLQAERQTDKETDGW